MFSRTTLPTILRPLGLALVALLCSSCGSNVKLVPVTGKVTVDGKALAGGLVSFVPQSEEAGHRVLPQGEIGADGVYELYTEKRKGAPLGRYRVNVLPPRSSFGGASKSKDESTALRFNFKFSDPVGSPLIVEVVGSPSPEAYDLKLTP